MSSIPQPIIFSNSNIDIALEAYVKTMPGQIIEQEKDGKFYKASVPVVVFNPLMNMYSVISFIVEDEQRYMSIMAEQMKERAIGLMNEIQGGDPDCEHDWKGAAGGMQCEKCKATM